MALALLLSLLLIPFRPEAVVEEKNYLLYAGKKAIGELRVERQTLGDRTVYRSANHTTYSLIKKFELKHEVACTFQQGQLQRSEVWVRLNGRLREHTLTTRSGTGYEVVRDGKDPFRLDEPIHFSSLSLYFEQPDSVTQVYSEQYGALFPIAAEGQGVYRLDRSGNRTNLYFYRSDSLVRAEFETLLFTARLESQ